LRHTGTVAAVQFDLGYLTNKVSAGSLQATGLAANVVIRSRQLSPSQQRVLAYTTNGSVFATNQQLGQIPFTVPAGDFTAGGRITLTNALAARHDASAATPLRLGHGAVLIQPIFRGDDGVVDLYLAVQSNQTYVVQATTDFAHWTNISTNFAALDYITVTDADAAGYAFRFYRAVPVSSFTGGQIGGFQLQTGGGFLFSYPAIAGRSYVLQGSTNLIDWANLATNAAAGSSLIFSNLITPAFPRRFFRVVELR
jgi:hypothetical protein